MNTITENIIVFCIVLSAAAFIARKSWRTIRLFVGSGSGKDGRTEPAFGMLGCDAGGKEGCAGCALATNFTSQGNRLPVLKPFVPLELVETSSKKDAPHPRP